MIKLLYITLLDKHSTVDTVFECKCTLINLCDIMYCTVIRECEPKKMRQLI